MCTTVICSKNKFDDKMEFFLLINAVFLNKFININLFKNTALISKKIPFYRQIYFYYKSL